MIASGGHGWGLAVFPLVAAAVAAVFAFRLAIRFAGRRRPAEGVWTVALAMYAVASAAMFLGVVSGWSGGEFRTYWLFGAVLNVPFLFAGEVYLLARRPWIGHAVLALSVAAGVFAGIEVWRAPLHMNELAHSLPLGKDAFGDNSTPYRLAQYFSLPAYFLLLGGLVWSSLGMKDRPALRARTVGTLGIALGATIVAIGSGIGAAFHVVPLFSAALAAGVGVMFWGFLKATRPAAPAARSPAAPAPSAGGA